MSETTNSAVTTKVNKTEAEWRELLTPEQGFQIMRQKGTERPFASPESEP